MILKRAFDILVAVLGLILLSPVFIILALWILIDSKGPVFYRQLRVGIFGEHFRIYKFRTMRIGSDQVGPLITIGADSRITRPGFFIRKYKLDEFPQLINVLLGDMSLVGPRPEVPKYVSLYPPDIREIVLSVRPGITDFASIEYRDENSILGSADDPERVYVEEILPKKLMLCKEYVVNRNFVVDLNIIIRTIFAIFFR